MLPSGRRRDAIADVARSMGQALRVGRKNRPGVAVAGSATDRLWIRPRNQSADTRALAGRWDRLA